MPQLRQNPITGDWVVIAPERIKRPTDYIGADEPRPKHAHDDCLFCVGGKVYAEQVSEFELEHVYVAPNKYPAFVEDPTSCTPRSFPTEHNFYRARPATGGHDVVVVKDDQSTLLTFSPAIWHDLLSMFQHRLSYFHDVCAVEYAMPIYNHKPAAGASIDHPHAQIFATNILPNLVAREVHTTYEYFEHHQRCVFCELVRHEQKECLRIIAENDTYVAFTFYAARFPFETWVMPKAHQDRFERSSPKEIKSLSEFMSGLMQQFDLKLKNPAMNMFLHTLPNSFDGADFFHWHIELAPRISNYGGFELGSGVVIDMVSPEHAADFLR